jgi:putative aldouronate transport system substrate-binding protein
MVFLAVLLLAAQALWGGGRSSASTGSGGRTTISWAMWAAGPVDAHTALEDRLEERFPDVDIQFIALERATWFDQINARVAGGDIPDIIYRDSQDVVAQYARQGLLAEIPFEKARQFAPNLYEASKSYGKEVWLAAYIDGKNYGLPILQRGIVASFSDQWRMDYLRKVGITKVPETLDEAEAAFERIIHADVNGTGRNDTYGLTFRGADVTYGMFNTIFAAYGTLPSKWMLNSDGTVVSGLMKEGAKDALARLADWYRKGYIDPEFVTTTGAIFNQKLSAGNITMLTWATWGRAIPPSGEFYVNSKAGDPNAELVVGPPLKGPSGQSGYYTWGNVTSSVTFGAHLARNEAKLNRCIQLVDALLANTDTNEYIRYGVEGVDWNRDPLTGAMVNAHTDANDQARFGSNLLGGIPGIPAFTERHVRNDEAEWGRYALAGTLQPEVDYFNWLGLIADSSKTSIDADISPAFYKGLFDIITGVRPLDDYDRLVREWYAAGGQGITDEMNRAYREGKAIIDSIVAQIR